MPDDGLEPSREQLDRAGRIDDTVMAIDGGRRRASCWRGGSLTSRQTLGSLDAFAVGARPEDRPWLARFLELAPGALRHGRARRRGHQPEQVEPAHATRCDASAERGRSTGAPLRFVNLLGFDPDRPYRLAANASRARISRSPVLRGLVERYAE